MKKVFIIFIVFIIGLSNSYSQNKGWVKILTGIAESAPRGTQSKAIKDALSDAFSKSSKATKKALLNMDIPPKDIQKITTRFTQKELKNLTNNGLESISPTTIRSLFSDLARFGDKSSNAKDLVEAINKNPKLLKAYERICQTGLGVKFRTDSKVLLDIYNKKSPIVLKTTNSSKLGEVIYGVKMVKRKISLGGLKYEGVFGDFDAISLSDIRLPKNLYGATDEQQMKFATKALRKQLAKEPNLASKFTKEQLDAIKNGYRKIPNYTWHHKEAPFGMMQLVPELAHSKVGHDGGKSLWNSGNR